VIDETGQLDAYVEGVLAGRRPEPQPLEGHEVEPALARAADLLARTLVRFHPSFRFEDALAASLRVEADDMVRRRRGGAADGSRLIAFPAVAGVPEAVRGRGLLLGGAIASGLSLAGAALLAWRRARRAAS